MIAEIEHRSIRLLCLYWAIENTMWTIRWTSKKMYLPTIRIVVRVCVLYVHILLYGQHTFCLFLSTSEWSEHLKKKCQFMDRHTLSYHHRLPTLSSFSLPPLNHCDIYESLFLFPMLTNAACIDTSHTKFKQILPIEKIESIFG